MTATLERDGTAAPRHRKRWWILAAVLAAVLIAGLAWTVLFSSLIAVRSVAVRGTHVLTTGEVIAAAHIKHGTPLVRLDTGAVEHRVERLPVVASARVETSFPSTVVITVIERSAVGYLRTGRSVALVDRTGTQYRTVAGPPAGLPEFVVPTGSSGRSAGRAVATVAAALPTALRAQLTSVQALDPGEITLVLRDGTVVRWGTAERSADKARVLLALLHRRASQIDVSNPDLPFTRD